MAENNTAPLTEAEEAERLAEQAVIQSSSERATILS